MCHMFIFRLLSATQTHVRPFWTEQFSLNNSSLLKIKIRVSWGFLTFPLQHDCHAEDSPLSICRQITGIS